MEFELDDELVELQRTVRDVVVRECPPELLRSVIAGDTGADGLWKTFVGLDWPMLAVPDELGGVGAGAVELVVMLEELGYVADPTPMLATASQYVPLVRECATGGQRRRLLASVGSGGTGAVSFAAGGVHARRDDGDWVLDGSAAHVVDGDRADVIAVVAATGDGPAVFAVPAGSLARSRQESFDGALHVAALHLDGVRVGADDAMVGPLVGRGIARATEEAVAGLAAMTVGACRRILDLVLDHVKQRHQFGVPIGSFQAVKHLAVDMYVAIERARALAQFAGLTIAEDDDRRVIAPSMAKAAAGDCQRIVFRLGIQLFGGLGFTWENDLQLYLRRAKAGELLLGGSAEHRERVARWALSAREEAEVRS
jgi:alkylation response protein AidB-like acyl-CoA dehydrogenase